MCTGGVLLNVGGVLIRAAFCCCQAAPDDVVTMLALGVDLGHCPDSGDLDCSAAHLVEASHCLDSQCGPRSQSMHRFRIHSTQSQNNLIMMAPGFLAQDHVSESLPFFCWLGSGSCHAQDYKTFSDSHHRRHYTFY